MKNLWIRGKIKKKHTHTHTEMLFLIIIKIEICGVWNSAELLEIFSGLYDPRIFLFHAIFTKTKMEICRLFCDFIFCINFSKLKPKKEVNYLKKRFLTRQEPFALRKNKNGCVFVCFFLIFPPIHKFFILDYSW